MSDLAIFGQSNQTSMLSTVSVETTQDKNRVLRALNMAESLATAVQVGQPFDVVDIFQTPGVRRARMEGMPDMPCTNTYFLCGDGRALMTQSDGIARSCNMLLALYPDCGKGTERGCLTLAVAERKLSNGNTIKSVVPVD